jgi:hypothetical protein
MTAQRRAKVDRPTTPLRDVRESASVAHILDRGLQDAHQGRVRGGLSRDEARTGGSELGRRAMVLSSDWPAARPGRSRPDYATICGGSTSRGVWPRASPMWTELGTTIERATSAGTGRLNR